MKFILAVTSLLFLNQACSSKSSQEQTANGKKGSANAGGADGVSEIYQIMYGKCLYTKFPVAMPASEFEGSEAKPGTCPASIKVGGSKTAKKIKACEAVMKEGAKYQWTLYDKHEDAEGKVYPLEAKDTAELCELQNEGLLYEGDEGDPEGGGSEEGGSEGEESAGEEV